MVDQLEGQLKSKALATSLMKLLAEDSALYVKILGLIPW